MQLKFLPNLAFLEEKVLEKVLKLCRKAEKKEYLARGQKWLGVLFSEEIEKGTQAQGIIQWIDERIGYGLFSEKDLAPFTYVGEYTGQVRKRKRADSKNHYCFDYSIGEGRKSPYIIDAERQGNLTRFINHSNDPNLVPVSVLSGNVMHVVLMAKRAIKAGEQFTYDYGPDYWKKRTPPV
jgi:hypothetical protein